MLGNLKRLVLELVSLGIWFPLAAQPQPLPNILLIITDDQGLHDVGYYGNKDLLMPLIDALAREGLRCDNFYAYRSVCSPTRAALLTGRYPSYVGVPGVIRTHNTNNWGFLNPESVLLP